VTTAGIILAGGASRRFGRDKLAEPLDGRPLLERAIEAVRRLTPDVVVVLAPGDDRPLPPDVRIAHDPVAHEGPLAGVAAGLAALDEAVDRVIVLGGDMPSASPAVLAALLGRLDDPAVDAAWLDDDGRARPLPLAIRRAPAAARATALLETGERRLRALPEALGAVVIDAPTWRALDPTGATLRDIDEPADLGAAG
jgi:molybdopterin-guanine dinucleotide biosynthesis protein A